MIRPESDKKFSFESGMRLTSEIISLEYQISTNKLKQLVNYQPFFDSDDLSSMIMKRFQSKQYQHKFSWSLKWCLCHTHLRWSWSNMGNLCSFSNPLLWWVFCLHEMKVCVSSLPRTTRDAVIQTVKHVESCRLESNENLLLFVPGHNENYGTYKLYKNYHFLAKYESGQNGSSRLGCPYYMLYVCARIRDLWAQ